MKSLKWIKIFLTLNLLLLGTTALAQEAKVETDFPACESEHFNELLFIVQCAKDNCPYANQQKSLYEFICPAEGFGLRLGEKRFYDILDNLDQVKNYPQVRNTDTLSPCDCLARLEEKFNCGNETCEVKSSPVPVVSAEKTENFPVKTPEQNLSGGCSLSTPSPTANLDIFSWLGMGLASIYISRKYTKIS